MSLGEKTVQRTIENALKDLSTARDIKVVLIDSAGNVISDISLSAHRDALKGTGNRDFTTLETDIEAILAQLDVALSTRASETTLSSILSQLDVALSTRASETTLTSIDGKLPANLTADGFFKMANFADKITEQKLSAAAIAAGATQNVDITVPAGKTGIAVTLKAAYDASATAGVRLDALYSADGINYDTDTDDTYTHPFDGGATKQKTYIIAAIHKYVRLAIVNLDDTYGVTVDLWVTYI